MSLTRSSAFGGIGLVAVSILLPPYLPQLSAPLATGYETGPIRRLNMIQHEADSSRINPSILALNVLITPESQDRTNPTVAPINVLPAKRKPVRKNPRVV